MKCPYQEGDFGNDIKYGYINVGKVVDGDKSYLGVIFFRYIHIKISTRYLLTRRLLSQIKYHYLVVC